MFSGKVKIYHEFLKLSGCQSFRVRRLDVLFYNLHQHFETYIYSEILSTASRLLHNWIKNSLKVLRGIYKLSWHLLFVATYGSISLLPLQSTSWIHILFCSTQIHRSLAWCTVISYMMAEWKTSAAASVHTQRSYRTSVPDDVQDELNQGHHLQLILSALFNHKQVAGSWFTAYGGKIPPLLTITGDPTTEGPTMSDS